MKPAGCSLETGVVKRNVVIGLNADDVTITLEATLPRQDERFESLVKGQLLIESFVAQVFDSLHVRLMPLSDLARGLVPQISIAGEVATVRVTVHQAELAAYQGTSVSRDLRWHSIVVDQLDADTVQCAIDTFEIRLGKMRLVTASKVPTTATSDTLTWTRDRRQTRLIGDQTERQLGFSTVLDVRMSSTGVGALTTKRIIAWSPFDALGRNADYFEDVWAVLLGSIGLLVLIALGRIGSAVAPSATPMRILVAVALGGALVSPIVLAARTVAKCLGAEGESNVFGLGDPRLVAVALAAWLGCSGILWIARSIPQRIRKGFEVLLRVLRDGVAVTLAISVASCFLMVATRHWECRRLLVLLGAPLFGSATYATLWLIEELRRDGPAPSMRRSRLAMAGAIGVGLALVVSNPPDHCAVDYLAMINATRLVQEAARHVGTLMPVMTAIAIMATLRSEAKASRDEAFCWVAALLLTFFTVGPRFEGQVLPIALLIAIVAFKNLALRRPGKAAPWISLRSKAEAQLCKLRCDALQELDWSALQDGVAVLRGKVGRGELTIDAYDAATAAIAARVEGLRRNRESLSVPPEASEREILFAWGPGSSNWDSGIRAMAWSVPLAIVFSLPYLTSRQSGHESLPLLGLLAGMGALLMTFLMHGFLFGFLFVSLRGANGLEKAAWVLLAIILAFMPSFSASIESPPRLYALGWRVVAEGILLGTLGLRFDLASFRAASIGRANWAQFFAMQGVRTLVAGVSGVLASVGVAISTALSGHATQVMALMLSMMLPQLPSANAAVAKEGPSPAVQRATSD